jgi:hypothetical protein
MIVLKPQMLETRNTKLNHFYWALNTRIINFPLSFRSQTLSFSLHPKQAGTRALTPKAFPIALSGYFSSQASQTEILDRQSAIQQEFNIRRSNLTPQMQHGTIENGLEGASSGLLHQVA